MNTLLIYPPHHKYKLKNITYVFDMEKRDYIGPLINRTTKYWNYLYDEIDINYRNKKKLPKGTKIYRCSTNKDPKIINPSNDKSPVAYFGLDFVISSWIGLEINEKSTEYIPCYLHVYELQKDLVYKYLYSPGGDGVPMELDPKTCIKKPCIHPQEILHGNEYPYKGNELGTEITIPLKDLDKIFKSVKTFKIDINELNKNKDKYIFEWDPINALK